MPSDVGGGRCPSCFLTAGLSGDRDRFRLELFGLWGMVGPCRL